MLSNPSWQNTFQRAALVKVVRPHPHGCDFRGQAQLNWACCTSAWNSLDSVTELRRVMPHTGYRPIPGPGCCTPYLLQARWMTTAALFLLRNSSFLLLSLCMICSRSSTGRRSIFTLCTKRGAGAGSVSLDI